MCEGGRRRGEGEEGGGKGGGGGEGGREKGGRGGEEVWEGREVGEVMEKGTGQLSEEGGKGEVRRKGQE